MVLAVEHIRRMRGGAQSHLMRCDDGGYYIVKFQNNRDYTFDKPISDLWGGSSVPLNGSAYHPSDSY